MKDTKILSARMGLELHNKFHYVAGAEGRTMSGQIICLIRQCVRDYEKANGPIPEDTEK